MTCSDLIPNLTNLVVEIAGSSSVHQQRLAKGYCVAGDGAWKDDAKPVHAQ